MEFPLETEQHRRLRDAIWARLNGWRRFLVVLDGFDGAGKTTLGRYLAWQLGMPLVETDMFLIRGAGVLTYRQEDLQRLIDSRLGNDRPAIMEGIRALHIVRTLGLKADYVIWVDQAERTPSQALQQSIADYVSEYKPVQSADFTFQWSLDADAPS